MRTLSQVELDNLEDKSDMRSDILKFLFGGLIILIGPLALLAIILSSNPAAQQDNTKAAFGRFQSPVR